MKTTAHRSTLDDAAEPNRGAGIARTNLADGTTLITDADGIVVAPGNAAAQLMRQGYRRVDADAQGVAN